MPANANDSRKEMHDDNSSDFLSHIFFSIVHNAVWMQPHFVRWIIRDASCLLGNTPFKYDGAMSM